jgi:ribosomal protein S18 acetylase RimI-like enzyme
MTKITVRQAKPGDVEPLLDLWQEMMDHHARLDPRLTPAADGRQAFRPTVERWMADSEWRVLVAKADGEIVGYAIGHVADINPVLAKPSYGYVTDICVSPGWRRHGVGRRLFKSMRTWFQRRDLAAVQLSVAALNPTAQAFWRAMGFGDYMNRLWLDI